MANYLLGALEHFQAVGYRSRFCVDPLIVESIILLRDGIVDHHTMELGYAIKKTIGLDIKEETTIPEVTTTTQFPILTGRVVSKR